MMKPRIFMAGFMTSIITNAVALSALDTLRSIGGNLQKTQQQVSSGLRVGTASDNAAYWSISTTMQSNNKVMDVVLDSLNLAHGILETAYSGMENLIEELSSIRSLVVLAAGMEKPPTTGATSSQASWRDWYFEGTEVAKIDKQINQHWKQIRSIIESSSFAGVNLLVNDADEGPITTSKTSFVSGYVDGRVLTTSLDKVSVVMVNYARTSESLSWDYPGETEMGFLDGYFLTGSAAWEGGLTQVIGGEVRENQSPYTLQQLEAVAQGNAAFITRQEAYDQFLNQFDLRMNSIIDGTATVGAKLKSIEGQGEFVAKMSDAITQGIGRLVDADMDEASTRLKALQTQEQLGIQALQIANTSADTIMQLFG